MSLRAVRAWVVAVVAVMFVGGCECDQKVFLLSVGGSCDEVQDSVNVDGSVSQTPLPVLPGSAPQPQAGDGFGSALAKVSGFNLPGVRISDTVANIVVGAPFSDLGATDAGAVWIQTLNRGLRRTEETVIASNRGGFSERLSRGDRFGSAVSGFVDLDLDGVGELLVGAPGDGRDRGSVWLLFMHDDGSVRSQQELRPPIGLNDGDHFGAALTTIKLSNDRIAALVVGAPGSDVGGDDAGAVWILFLDASGQVSDTVLITTGLAGFTGALGGRDGFGSALAALGDLDGDGVPELAVGAPGNDGDGLDRGAVWVLFMTRDGAVKSQQRIDDAEFTGVRRLRNGDAFGSALANVARSPTNVVARVVVGAPGDDSAGSDRGAFWTLDLDSGGTVLFNSKTTEGRNGFGGPLRDDDHFGAALADLGDPDDDGQTDLGVGAPGSDGDNGDVPDQGSYWILKIQ